jgi:hypothetical protein
MGVGVKGLEEKEKKQKVGTQKERTERRVGQENPNEGRRKKVGGLMQKGTTSRQRQRETQDGRPVSGENDSRTKIASGAQLRGNKEGREGRPKKEPREGDQKTGTGWSGERERSRGVKIHMSTK